MPVLSQIHDEGGSGEFLDLDLASLESARGTALRFVESGRPLRILVNNAGVGIGRGATKDGFELQFGVNHLGHFMLTHHLEPALQPGSRLVQVTSAAHFNADGIDFDRVTAKTRSLLGWREYGVSKLANVLFAKEMGRRRPDLATYAVHPGMTDTGMIPGWVRRILRGRLFTPEQGAETVVWCATSTEVSGESGRYYRNKESRDPSPIAQDADLARELWARSVRWCDLGN